MIVPAGVGVLERARLVVTTLGVQTAEKKAFDLVRGVERVAVAFEAIGRQPLEDTANVCIERRTVAIQDVAEDEDFAGTEHVGRSPIERAPIDRKPQVALALRGE